jgi:ABC-type Fe3+/spermidine/putrescine transport system ATPase subunit
MAVSDRIAVMRNGILAQFASPQELYDRPANAFVAGFIGGFSALPMAEFATGDGYLVIRPEDARPADVTSDMILTGRITARAFQGRCWRLTLEIGNTRVKIDWPSDVSVGQTLSFSLPSDRRLIVNH